MENNILKNNHLLLKTITGSHMYGLAHAKSDTDYRGIYLLNETNYKKCDSRKLKHNEFPNQLNDEKHNEVYYELKRFLDLIQKGNPTCIELLFADDKWVQERHPILDELFDMRNEFLTKEFCITLYQFIQSQIKKAKGANKLAFAPEAKVYKTPIEFCYRLDNSTQRSSSLQDFLQSKGIKQQACGIARVHNTRDVYALYWDKTQQRLFFDEATFFSRAELAFRRKFDIKKGFGYKGIELEDKSSSMLRLSEIPKDEKPFLLFSYNPQSYTDYINEYHRYVKWLENRNEERYHENLLASKGYDTKNMAHCYRMLIQLSHFLMHKEFVVEAMDKEEIFKIKKGEYTWEYLSTVIDQLSERIKRLIDLYPENTKPFPNLDILERKIRKKFYNQFKK